MGQIINANESLSLVRKKFGRRKYLKSRYIPRYPITAEREYRRMGRRYAKSIDKSISKYIAELEREESDSHGYHADAGSFRSKRQIAKDMDRELEQAIQEMHLNDDVWKAAKIARNSAVTQWGKAANRTFGRKIDFRYYRDLCNARCGDWAYRGVAALGSMVNGAKEKIVRTVGETVDAGREVADQVRGILGDLWNAIDRVTTNEIGNLYEILSRLIQEDAGCTKYVWKTMRDGRVRECHAMFEGRVFDWNEPPEIWYRAGGGIVYTGRFCHPGEDYNCRCCAQPIFEADSMNVRFAL